MPDTTTLVKAELRELDAEFKNEINRDTSRTTVQFNPETLKVSFQNQIATPSGAGDQRGTPARQYVGAGTTKLSLQLWFDVSVPVPAGALPKGETQVDDVRKLTQRVAYFITPKETTDQPPKFLPPAVRFVWGSFQFDGLIDSMEESLEFFSNEGKPLRASVTISLSQQKIQKFVFASTGASTPPGGGAGAAGAPAGTRPLSQAPAGATLQGMAAAQGRAGDWQGIAAANNIENPRLLAPGQLIDLNASVSTSLTAGVESPRITSPSQPIELGASANISLG